MAHLTPAAFIDLLDGTVDQSDVPHLSSCAACREQLAALRRVDSAASDVDVPEPSPLFWDQLSARVREAVAAESAVPPWWWDRALSWRGVAMASGAVAIIALAVFIQLPRGSGHVPSVVEQTPNAVSARVDPAPDDASLRFVADLASGLGWDDVADAGLVSRDSGERAVSAMDQSERAELERLLNEALAKGGV